MTTAFSVEFPKATSDFQMSITFLSVNKNTKCLYLFFNWILRNILVIKLPLLGFAEIFFTQAPEVSVL